MNQFGCEPPEQNQEIPRCLHLPALLAILRTDNASLLFVDFPLIIQKIIRTCAFI